MTGQQLLRDPSTGPTDEVIAAGLGAANGAYMKFIGGLKKHDIGVDWRYYNDGKAWLGKALYKWTSSRGTPKETTIFWLSVWEGFFRVSIFMPEKARAEALALPLGDGVREMIGNAKQMVKLKFFPLIFDLTSDGLFDEIYVLADFRKMMK